MGRWNRFLLGNLCGGVKKQTDITELFCDLHTYARAHRHTMLKNIIDL